MSIYRKLLDYTELNYNNTWQTFSKQFIDFQTDRQTQWMTGPDFKKYTDYWGQEILSTGYKKYWLKFQRNTNFSFKEILT